MMMLGPSLALLGFGLAAQAPDIRTGEQLVAAMHARYTKSWYRTLSFVQRVIWADGRPEGEWWEAAMLPGRLRIDIAPIDSGNGVIYRGDSVYRFSQRQVQAAADMNPLLVLGFDVYTQPPARTVEVLKQRGFALSRVKEDEWEGRPAYVVGSDGRQFWVDKARLVFVRLVETAPNGTVSDIRFNKYQPLGGGWIAPEVVFLRNGQEFMREIYRDMRANPPEIDEALFAVPPWTRPAWVPARP
jgi:hypothetical protein